MKKMAFSATLTRFWVPGFALVLPVVLLFVHLISSERGEGGDYMNSCARPYPVGICGSFVTEEAIGVYDSIEVRLSGDVSDTTSTDTTGTFCFTGLEAGNTYLVTPFKDDDHFSGVSIFDFVLINKHLLGVQPLGSPYKMIAADVDNSGSISGMDLIALRRVIIGEADGFPNNTSWRFIDPSYVFPDPQDPWLEPFPESRLLTAVELPPLAVSASYEFLAIKVGNVNGD